MKRTPASRTFSEPPVPRFGYLLRQAAASHRLRMDRALADLGVTAPQFLVLRLMEGHPGSSNADISRMASLSTPTVSLIVANLRRAGALESRPHAVHGRVQHLDLTETGRGLLAAGEDRVRQVEAELLRGMTPDEIKIVGIWLRRVAAAADSPGDADDSG